MSSFIVNSLHIHSRSKKCICLSFSYFGINMILPCYVVPLEVMSSASIFAIYIMFIEHHIASPEKVFHICVFTKLSKYFSNYAQNW